MGVNELKILRWRNYPRLSGWAWCNQNGPKRETPKKWELQERVTWWWKLTLEWHTVKVDEDDTRQGIQVATRKGDIKRWHKFSEPSEGTSSAGTLTLALWGWFGASDPHNCKIIYSCYFTACGNLLQHQKDANTPCKMFLSIFIEIHFLWICKIAGYSKIINYFL